MSKCQYKVLNNPSTHTLLEPVVNQSKAQKEFQGKKEEVLQSFKGEAWQTVSFSKNKKSNHRTKELSQSPGELHDHNMSMPGNFSSLSLNKKFVKGISISKVTNKVSSIKFLDKNPTHKIYTTTDNKFEALVNPPKLINFHKTKSGDNEIICMAIDVATAHKLDDRLAAKTVGQLNHMQGDHLISSTNNTLISPNNTPITNSKALQNSTANLITPSNQTITCMTELFYPTNGQ